MKFHCALLAIASTVFLAACGTAPQQPVAMASGSSVSTGTKVGVVMSVVPQVDTYLPGAGCLLCYAAASMANSSLTSHVKTLPSDDLLQLREEIAAAMKKKGAQVIVIDKLVAIDALPDYPSKGINIARKDFSALAHQYQVDKLIVIQWSGVGVERTYSSYVPTSDPKGMVRGFGYLVNVANNSYEWYQPVEVLKGAIGNWDEPPKFPGVTNAYFQALESARDQLAKPFVN